MVPDILHTLNQMQQIQRTDCPSCLIVLGGYPKERTWKNLEWNLLRWNWFFSSGNNMGMVFDRDFWNKFLKCGYQFCTIDDYNWDWTLQHLNTGCFPKRLQTLKPDGPRVFHVGDCGTHVNRKSVCGRLRQLEMIKKVESFIENSSHSLFPVDFQLISQIKFKPQKTPGKST